MKLAFILGIAGLLPHPATAADLTLPAAVERALARFPSVAAARAQQRQAQ
jgi:hypothetical protein